MAHASFVRSVLPACFSCVLTGDGGRGMMRAGGAASEQNENSVSAANACLLKVANMISKVSKALAELVRKGVDAWGLMSCSRCSEP